MFGFDPLYLANEGKVLVVVSEADCDEVIKAMKANPLGINSGIIGRISPENNDMVIINTVAGGKRILDLPSGTQLPRIC
jgi:hydrogenase expression/formation protein HypE